MSAQCPSRAMRRLKLVEQLAALCRPLLAKSGSKTCSDGSIVCGSVRDSAEGTRSCAIQNGRLNIQQLLRQAEQRGKATPLEQIDGWRANFEVLAHFYSGKLVAKLEFVAAITHSFFFFAIC